MCVLNLYKSVGCHTSGLVNSLLFKDFKDYFSLINFQTFSRLFYFFVKIPYFFIGLQNIFESPYFFIVFKDAWQPWWLDQSVLI